MSSLTNLFKKPKTPDTIRMPVQEDAATRAAQERQRRATANRTGRASTRLSGRTGEAGTTSYGNSLLGSAG